MSFGLPPVEPGRFEDKPAPEPKSERRNTSVPRTPAPPVTSSAANRVQVELPRTDRLAKFCYAVLLVVALWPACSILTLVVFGAGDAGLYRLLLSLSPVILGYIVCRAIDRLTS